MSRSFHVPRVLLLVETSRAYGRGIVEGVARYALENGPWSIQFEERSLESSPPEGLKPWRGDGIISRTVSSKTASLLSATKLPLVELFGYPRIGCAQVWTESLTGGRMVAEHFLNCGLREFAYFAYENTWWTENYRESFCQALEEKGYLCRVYPSPSTPRGMPLWHERYRSRVIGWLRSLPYPVGILAAGDPHAVRLLDICRELNVAVPEEVAILGIGNDPVLCETVHPTISSLDVDGQRVGYEAAKLLDRKMSGQRPKDVVYVPPSHVAVRQSTDLLVIEDADVAQAARFIRRFACSGVNIDRVALEVGLSRRVMERRFRQYLGRSPKTEIMRIRIERAKTLLSQTDQTNAAIARQCGFPSPVYFSKAFRREVGMTPNAYRRMRRISRDFGEAAEDPSHAGSFLPPPPRRVRRIQKFSRISRKRRVPRILLLIETSRVYGRKLVEGIARYAWENGPWSIHFEERGLDSSPPAWLKEWWGDGIIVRSTKMKLVRLLRATRLPMVDLFADRRIDSAPEIRPDMNSQAQMAVEHFLRCGLRHFAYFTFEDASWTKRHRTAYCEALAEQGLACHGYDAPATKKTVPVWHEQQRPRLVQWLRSLPRPIGIFTAGDPHASRLLDVCRELKIAVPEELAILGVGNDPVICETVQPTLSSLDLDARSIGFETAKLLDRKMKGKRSAGAVSIPPSHIAVRQSTNIVAIRDSSVAQAMRFIREFACSGIGVTRVAREVGLSSAVLERRFQKHLGHSPKAEIMRIRIEHAKTLLSQTDQTTKSIAHKCGFHRLAYFINAFRNKVGLTPNAYRRMRRISRDLRESVE
ncbi:MAG: substrate-binding domain-containing protein [Pirellulales bacterium]|nr:substrate-binding domain-containing protein [Pirellulales bacterium]